MKPNIRQPRKAYLKNYFRRNLVYSCNVPQKNYRKGKRDLCNEVVESRGVSTQVVGAGIENVLLMQDKMVYGSEI